MSILKLAFDGAYSPEHSLHAPEVYAPMDCRWIQMVQKSNQISCMNLYSRELVRKKIIFEAQVLNN